MTNCAEEDVDQPQAHDDDEDDADYPADRFGKRDLA